MGRAPPRFGGARAVALLPRPSPASRPAFRRLSYAGSADCVPPDCGFSRPPCAPAGRRVCDECRARRRPGLLSYIGGQKAGPLGRP
ncbi:unnamed protein product, partial [Amoebophrya sp. A120]|eukprot:GSA120T00013125001.1